MSRANSRSPGLASSLDRELGTIGTQSVLLSQAVAERLGLHPTEVEVLDLLGRAGPLTAGQVAEVTGLTTGAATRLIDRLERAGYVRRAPNPHDRRSVLVVPIGELLARDVAPLYEPLERALATLYARYSDDQLALILDFVSSANTAIREHIARLRSAAPDGPSEPGT